MRVGQRKGRIIFPSQHHRAVCFSIPEKRSVAAITLMNSPTRQLHLPGGATPEPLCSGYRISEQTLVTLGKFFTVGLF